MSEEFKTFPCAECGGAVRMLPPAGELREFRWGIRVPIPEDVLIPKCEQCGETYFSEEDSARVDAAVRSAYLDRQQYLYEALVGVIKQANGCTLRDIEDVCAVTPTYFSHVMKGRRVASLTLTRLLEMLAADAVAFDRYRRGGRSSSTCVAVEAIARSPAPESRKGFLCKAAQKWGHADVFVSAPSTDPMRDAS
jgi:hypothetical protein